MDSEDTAEEAVGGGKLIQETADFAGMDNRLRAKEPAAGVGAVVAAAGLLMPDELLVPTDRRNRRQLRALHGELQRLLRDRL